MSATTRTPETAVPTETTIDTEFGSTAWRGGIVAGLGAGLVMAALMVWQTPDAIETAIPALYGQEGEFIGLFAHLSHAAIFGVLFAAIVVFARLSTYAIRPLTGAALGLAFGLLLWVGGAELLMPLWLDAVGAASVPEIFSFDLIGGVTHAVYGIVLGLAFPYLRDL